MNIETEMPGRMWKVLVKEGQRVESGATLFILEVMKTEVSHVAPEAGTVRAVHVREGEFVDGGVLAIELD